MAWAGDRSASWSAALDYDMPSRAATGNGCWQLTTRKDKRVGRWAEASNADIAYTPANAS
jgi:hypothetical protein